jgi:hypothetical protein
MQKIVLGGVVAAVLAGGAAWAAMEASNSQGSRVTLPAPGGVRHPGRFGPGAKLGPRGYGRPGPGIGLEGPLAGRGLLCDVAHAELTVVQGGTSHQIRLDRGTITSVSAHSVTVAEADGTSVTIPVDPDTRILAYDQPASLSQLEEGDTVFAVREGSGSATSLRAFDAGRDPCSLRPRGGGLPVPAPSPSPSASSA